jgi:hypothetical protein
LHLALLNAVLEMFLVYFTNLDCVFLSSRQQSSSKCYLQCVPHHFCHTNTSK